MKRVAVITFFQSQDNYGQLLQCFALQKTLQKLETSPCVIRYGFHRQYFHWKQLKLSSPKSSIHIILKCLKIFIHEKLKSEYPNRYFDNFRHNYIQFTSRSYNTLEELQRNPPKADIYITGSDQVWAQLLSNHNNRSFFLDFGEESTKRISYAPSFALENYPKDLQAELQILLNRFDAISVREETGISICNKANVKAKLVLDPTLLLTAEEYNCAPITNNNKKYCFAYHVNIMSSEELQWTSVRKYNEQHGLLTYAAYANPNNTIDMEILKSAIYVYPTIPQWIEWIKNSEYVLTSSYHGIIFSIIFHIPFVVCLRKESMFAGNNRVLTLLKPLGLLNRILTTEKNIERILSEKIEWLKIDSILSVLRNDSFNFLHDNIK